MTQILKTFEKRISEMTEQNILDFSKSDNGIFNVVSRFHNESFGTGLWDDSKANVDYFLVYVTRNSADKLQGFILHLQPHLKTRNDLTGYFAAFICKRYSVNISDCHSVFNTYQDQQRTLFEKLGYWTYDDVLLNEFKGKNCELFIKGNGLLYVPFAKPIDTFNTTYKGQDKRVNKKNENGNSNFVYLMHNRHNNYYKIGRSIKPVYREKTLQAQEPDIILIEKWMASPEIEKMLHRKFKDKRKRGEWFHLTEDDIIEIKTFMTGYVKTKEND